MICHGRKQLAPRTFGRLLGKAYTATILALSAYPSAAFCEPVPVYDQFPLYAQRLTFAPRGGVLQAPLNQALWHLDYQAANTFALRDHYEIDAESHSLDIGMLYGLSSTKTLGARLPLRYEGGGVFDNTIDEWHKFFGMPRGRRDQRQEGDHTVSGVTRGGDEFNWERPGNHLAAPSVFLREQISGCSVIHAEALIPVGTGPQSPSLPDVVVGVEHTSPYSLGTWSFGAAALYYPDQFAQGVRYRALHGEAYVGTTIGIVDSLDLVAVTSVKEGSVSNIPTTPDLISYLDTGLRWRVSRNYALTFSVRENPWPRRFSTDVTASISLGTYQSGRQWLE